MQKSRCQAAPAGGGGWGVCVADDDRARAARAAGLLRHALADTGAAVHERADHPTAQIALVGVERTGEGAARGLAAIARWRARGRIVLAQGAGLDGWTMAEKCRPLIAGAGRVFDAGAADYGAELTRAVADALARLRARQAEDEHVRERLRACGVVGESAPMLELFRQVLRFSALSDLPVLITGETGTGKERFAQALHRSDPKRSRGALVAVNCAALAPTLAESELFGHRRGAFTGAERARPGLVRAAEGGVLFLDEIGELDGTLQAKLLRVLQEGRVLGVGEETEVAVDVRVVAATNRDLKARVAAGRFRADLYHRLCVLALELPPLRGRRADIARLVEHFLEKYGALRRGRREAPSADFVEALCRHPLPGNVRQLENVVRQALVQKSDDGPLALGDLPLEVLDDLAHAEAGGGEREAEPDVDAAADAASPRQPESVATSEFASTEAAQAAGRSILRIAEENGWNLSRSVRACEREVLRAVLRRAQGNQTKAASLLGVTTRSIYNKVRKLGVEL